MDAIELAAIVAAVQFSAAVKALLARAGGSCKNPWAVAACAVGTQLASQVNTVATAAAAAAQSEFTNGQAAERAVASSLQGLPPIS